MCSIPKHIAVIMDGNGRWAAERGLPRVKGHHEGVNSVREIVETSAEIGVEYLTLYTFSTENWSRSDQEVSALMHLLIRTLKKELQTFMKNGIRLKAIGELDRLPAAAQKELRDAIHKSRNNDRMTLVLALSYSGRSEIISAVQKIAASVVKGDLDPESISTEHFEAALDTANVPDPDLLIRTGGEIRVSNYLLWQIAYTELYFTDTFWPSFRRKELVAAIEDYQNRERRFGRVLEEWQ